MTRASLPRSPKRTTASRTKLRGKSLALLLLAEQRASAQLCTYSSPGGPNCTICTATQDYFGTSISGVCDGTYSGGAYGSSRLCALRLPRPPRPATSAPATSPSARPTRARTR
jgi:hypothetical protein